MTKTEKPTNGKPKQAHLPGMTPPKLPKVERLADRFEEARNEWQAAKQPMLDARDLLETAMKEAGITRYEFGGKVVEIIAEEKVTVRKLKETADV